MQSKFSHCSNSEAGKKFKQGKIAKHGNEAVCCSLGGKINLVSMRECEEMQ